MGLMNRHHKGKAALLALAAWLAATGPVQAKEAPPANEEIRLWDKVPADTYWKGPEQASESAAPTGSRIQIKSNVTDPTLTVVRPASGKANGSAMIVAPGGAFMALAWDLEGLEVARWLADRGITAFILKYRVGPPPRNATDPLPTNIEGLLRMLEPNRKLAIADASQAVRLVRKQAARFGVAPNRIGVMGFSAGAMTTMGVVLEGGLDARPNFVAPIYGMLATAAPVPAAAPPVFIATAADDTTVPPAGSIEIFEKWKAAKRPAELHIYEKGQHGFGMRAQGLPVDHWTAAFEAWLRAQGVIGKMEDVAHP